MPTSVLLAVLAAAGLLALAPALVRRYDATERLAAERAQSTARVLDRARRRRRTVPGPRPLYGPRLVTDPLAESGPSVAESSASSIAWQMGTVEISMVPAPRTESDPLLRANGDGSSAVAADREPVGHAVWLPLSAPTNSVRPAAAGDRPSAAGDRPSARRPAGPSHTRRIAPTQRHSRQSGSTRRARVGQSPAVYRRRRVLASLVVLNAVELVGIFTVSPGFWTGFGVTLAMLVGYVVHLRNVSLAAARARRVAARRSALVAAIQAEIREEQALRAAARREALRRAAAARANAQREATRLSQRYIDFDPPRRVRVRGQQYETGGWDVRAVAQ